MPLQDAQIGATTVAWMPRGAVLVAPCAVFGVFFVVMGGRYTYRGVERQTLTLVRWVLFATVAIVALDGFPRTWSVMRLGCGGN